jgi:hypothetical protein
MNGMDSSVRAHQGGWFLGLALLGLVLPLLLLPFGAPGILFAPLAPVMCIAALFLGRSELIGMKAGTVDASGRLITRVAWVIALVGALLWSSLFVLLAVGLRFGGGVGPL